jgi:hypothetical protein
MYNQKYTNVRTGGSDYVAARKYIADKFITVAQTRYPDNYICATDTSQVKMLFDRIIDKV